jgi:tRNA-specific 2-thiouridylase
MMLNNEVVNIDKAKATTPGQECVFYDGEVCLGGGTISEVIK